MHPDTPKDSAATVNEENGISRGEFVKRAMVATAGSALAMASAESASGADKPAESPAPKTPESGFPQGKLGKLQMSRLILGSNMITGCVHARDMWTFVNNLNKRYNTDEKVLETLALAEKNGINTIMTQPNARYMKVLKKYRNEMGGKLQWVMCAGGAEKESIREQCREGVEAMYIFGHTCDQLCAKGDRDTLVRILENIKENEIPAGICCHDLEVVKFCEEKNVGADFYVKTFHHHQYRTAPKPEQLKGPVAEVPGYWCKDPAETIKVMKEVKKPWIAFKVMAAGVIPPASAFKYAYENGSDFILAGMYDFEIEEDVKIARDVLANLPKRTRPWMG